jgi:pentose-5-phosphate-3-epimerase
MDELTQRLAAEQSVTVGGSKPSIDDLRNRIEKIGTVLIKFTETRGGTDLGVQIDGAATNSTAANFDEGTGTVHVEGTLILNDDPVRCIADIDLATLNGTGRLVVVKESELVG